MNWFQWIMLGLALVFTIFAPVALTKAILRKNKQGIFELVISILFGAYWLIDSLSPAVLENIDPILRWVLAPAALLFGANMFGFSGWLFSRHKKRTMP